MAWKITPNLFLGGGVYYLYARNEVENRVDQSNFNSSDGRFRLKLDGDAWGYDFGILFQPSHWVRLGAAYRSSVDVDLEGDAKLSRIAPLLQPVFGGTSFKADVNSELNLPPVVSIGMALFPNKKLTAGIDIEWVGWSRYDRTILDFNNETAIPGFSDTTLNHDWNDSWLFKGGLEYQTGDRVALRAGYSFVESPVPEKTLSPAAPDADQHNFSIGLGYRHGAYWLDTFYMLSLFEDRKVTNSILSGKYESTSHYFGFGFGYKFF
jgi:long-chain fatty acid transport protein